MSSTAARARATGLTAAIAQLAAEDTFRLDDDEIGESLVEIRRCIAQLEGEFVRRLRVFDARVGWATEKARSLKCWLQLRCRLSAGAAKARIVVSRRLPELPATQAALAAGQIDFPHAHAIAAGTAGLPEKAVRESEHVLVAAASECSPAQTRQLVKHFRYVVDPVSADREALHAHEERWLDVARTFDGYVSISGLLDPETGEVFLTALDSVTPPPTRGDMRTTPQRHADGLRELSRLLLDGGMLPDSGGEKPHLNVLVDLASLESKDGVARLQSGEPIAPETLRRICCDSIVTRIVMSGPSEVIDVGRKTRIVNSAQRRALAARDGGCVEPGCETPPHWCDAHHRISWLDGGPTDLNNLELRCRHHHVVEHHRRE